MLQVDGERHIILATDAQLNLLAGAKRWYADGTFKVVRKPFYQLGTIHAFLRENDNVKQFPLLFCLVSSRRKRDYKAVLRSVLNLLPSAPSVEEFVTDFESATWKAVASVLPETKLQGCAFHWGQAVWRKTQEIGLKRAYVNDDSTNKYVKKLLSLPLLPAEHIPPVFTALQLKANTDKLTELTDYIQKTWITSTTWPPSNWSVFGQSVRTNNDVEGWHQKLNAETRPSTGLYHLSSILNTESSQLKLNMRLLSERKVRRHQRANAQEIHVRLTVQWDRYRSEEITAMKLLRLCAGIYGPPSS